MPCVLYRKPARILAAKKNNGSERFHIVQSMLSNEYSLIVLLLLKIISRKDAKLIKVYDCLLIH